MVSTFKERLAPLANSGLTKAEMNKALVDCGADEFISSLEDKGVSKLDALLLLGSMINELSLFDNSSR
jgi:ABC-type multidrug transport system fused ATPase/permease subunit